MFDQRASERECEAGEAQPSKRVARRIEEEGNRSDPKCLRVRDGGKDRAGVYYLIIYILLALLRSRAGPAVE